MRTSSGTLGGRNRQARSTGKGGREGREGGREGREGGREEE